MAPQKILTTLVAGAGALDREQAIANTLANSADSGMAKVAVLLEGLPLGKTLLIPGDNLIIERIATGCLCCTNNMIMRTYLNRLIQQKPQRLLVSLSTDTHLEQIRQFLTTSGYEKVLEVPVVLTISS